MTTEGIYYLTAEVTDDESNTYTDTFAIAVMDKTEVVALLNAKWDEMTAALIDGDIEKALNYFVAASRDRYGETFTNLGSIKINSIFSGITGINLYSLDERMAECGAIRIETGATYSYPVTFVKDENGIWKIMGF